MGLFGRKKEKTNSGMQDNEQISLLYEVMTLCIERLRNGCEEAGYSFYANREIAYFVLFKKMLVHLGIMDNKQAQTVHNMYGITASKNADLGLKSFDEIAQFFEKWIDATLKDFGANAFSNATQVIEIQLTKMENSSNNELEEVRQRVLITMPIISDCLQILAQ